MAKSKRKSLSRQGKQKDSTKSNGETQQANDSSHEPLQPDPPRRNFPLLILSGILFGVWFVYLLIVAIFG